MSIYYVFNNYCEKKIDWYDFIISLIEKLLPTHFIFVFIYIYIYIIICIEMTVMLTLIQYHVKKKLSLLALDIFLTGV